MKVKSITDVITNSSSEVFLIRSNKSSKEIQKDLDVIGSTDESSGMGGYLVVSEQKDYEERPEEFESTGGYYLPEGYLLVDIDWAMSKTVNYLKEHYDVIEDDHVLDILEKYNCYHDIDLGDSKRLYDNYIEIFGGDESFEEWNTKLIENKKKATDDYLRWLETENM